MRFNGSDYDHERDDGRLSAQMDRVREVMQDGNWRGLAELAVTTGDPPASVSAQLRHLRKARFGAYIVEKKYVENGLYLYRILRPRVEKQEEFAL
jgi:hypothetical protein